MRQKVIQIGIPNLSVNKILNNTGGSICEQNKLQMGQATSQAVQELVDFVPIGIGQIAKHFHCGILLVTRPRSIQIELARREKKIAVGPAGLV